RTAVSSNSLNVIRSTTFHSGDETTPPTARGGNSSGHGIAARSGKTEHTRKRTKTQETPGPHAARSAAGGRATPIGALPHRREPRTTTPTPAKFRPAPGDHTPWAAPHEHENHHTRPGHHTGPCTGVPDVQPPPGPPHSTDPRPTPCRSHPETGHQVRAIRI